MERDDSVCLAPVALFAYRRPIHLARCLAALASNPEAPSTHLIVYSEGPGSPDEQPLIAEVRAILHAVRGFRTVTVVERPHRIGLSRSVTTGVSEVLERHDRVIVLEDDLLVSKHFLRYMNDGLSLYDSDDRVASIHGYVYPVKQSLPETFFLRGADCWGWATWTKQWKRYRSDGATLLKELRESGLDYDFDLRGACSYVKMLQDQVAGLNDSWAIRWRAATFLRGMLTLYPGRSLVRNIGNDRSGVHCSETDLFDGPIATEPVRVLPMEVTESAEGMAAYEAFYRGLRRRKVVARIKYIGRSVMSEVDDAVRNAAKGMVPPAVLPVLRRSTLGRRMGNSLLGHYSTWAEAAAASSGYDSGDIFAKVLHSTRAVQRGEAAYERDTVLFNRVQYSWPLLASLLRVHAETGSLRVVDFGGALGGTYRQNRAYLRGLPGLSWRVVEQPGLVALSRQLDDEGIVFLTDLTEALQCGVDVVLFASSLCYVEFPYALLEEVARSKASFLIIDRTPFQEGDRDRITVQRVPRRVYDASYPCRVFGRAAFLATIGRDWELVESWDCGQQLVADVEFGGCFCRRKER